MNKRIRKMLALLLTAALMLMFVPLTALADPDEKYIDMNAGNLLNTPSAFFRAALENELVKGETSSIITRLP